MSYRCTGFVWCGEYLERGLRCAKCEARSLQAILGSGKEKVPPQDGEDVGHAPLSLFLGTDSGVESSNTPPSGKVLREARRLADKPDATASQYLREDGVAPILSRPLSLAGECEDSDILWQQGRIVEWKYWPRGHRKKV